MLRGKIIRSAFRWCLEKSFLVQIHKGVACLFFCFFVFVFLVEIIKSLED